MKWCAPHYIFTGCVWTHAQTPENHWQCEWAKIRTNHRTHFLCVWTRLLIREAEIFYSKGAPDSCSDTVKYLWLWWKCWRRSEFITIVDTVTRSKGFSERHMTNWKHASCPSSHTTCCIVFTHVADALIDTDWSPNARRKHKRNGLYYLVEHKVRLHFIIHADVSLHHKAGKHQGELCITSGCPISSRAIAYPYISTDLSSSVKPSTCQRHRNTLMNESPNHWY